MSSQYGEDLIVAGILPQPRGLAVEIGAGDGEHLSNTALFRERGWFTILVEADPQYQQALSSLEEDRRVVVFLEPATPENINELVSEDADFVSIDVDGEDIFLLEALNHRPKVICIEYNPTMGYHFDVAPARMGLQIGASLRALMRVAEDKGYGLVAATECNAIFERDKPHMDLVLPEPAYVVATEYFSGRPITIGVAPWGVDFANPYPVDDVVIR